MHKKILKNLRYFISKYLKIESVVVILLIAILLAQIIGAGFIFSKFKKINSDLVSLNLQFIRLNNEQTEMKATLTNSQNMLMQMQSRLYRLNAQGEE